MGFTLGVQNAPASATQWMAQCNYYSTGPGMTAPLLLSQRWNSLAPAPGENWLGIVCFDEEGYIVKESVVEVTIEDGRDYTFDFATETLQVITVPAAGCLPLVIIGGLILLGVVAAVAFAMA